jgi:hypothetical protein
MFSIDAVEIGDIAVCRRGYTGLILKRTKIRRGDALVDWVGGVRIDPGHVGERWESVDPRKVSNINAALKSG